jgi:hypothetical protein
MVVSIPRILCALDFPTEWNSHLLTLSPNIWTFHILKGLIIYLYIMILSRSLVTRHKIT